MAKITGPRKIVLDTLARHGGVIEDPDGQATIRLFEAMGRDDITLKALQNSLGKMDQQGMVVRDVRGKRTYSIGLPQDQDAASSHHDGSTDGQRARRSRDGRDEPASVDGRARADGAEGIDYAALATALLNRVAEVLAAGDPSEMADLLNRLGEQTQAAQALTRRNMEMSDELLAVKSERDGLRQRLHALEDNVKAILKGDKAPDTRKLRALEQFISKPPARRG